MSQNRSMENKAEMFQIENLIHSFPRSTISSPLKETFETENFVEDDNETGSGRSSRILADISLNSLKSMAQLKNDNDDLNEIPSFELAGPRGNIFWNPKITKVAIVTCGGIAPGLNNVVQNLVTFLYSRYKVRHIYGVPYGFQGFVHDTSTKKFDFQWRRLDPVAVQNIDFEGGSILGAGRGHSNPQVIVDALVLKNIQILFTAGGDGTLTGAGEIHQEIKRRGLPIGIIGIPKTIDNDVPWVSKTFGFGSAVGKAAEALLCAQTEARSAYNGIGLVKIMGRNSGALTATAAVAVSDIDFVLVPEVPLRLKGKNGFLQAVVKKVLNKGYVTIAVAEGAGQDLFPVVAGEEQRDASGNLKLKDIGRLLEKEILAECKRNNVEVSLKYIDPSYILRSQKTSPEDSVFCANLSQNSVHAAMAGKTGCLIGYAHERFTHVPLSAVTFGRKQLDVNGSLWLSVLAATGQPANWE